MSTSSYPSPSSPHIGLYCTLLPLVYTVITEFCRENRLIRKRFPRFGCGKEDPFVHFKLATVGLLKREQSRCKK